VRAALPDSKPLLVRISATEWVEGGWSVEETVRLSPLLAARGVDLIDVSSAGNVPARFDIGPGYQVSLARAVKETGIPTTAVGLITDPIQAETILFEGDADAICIGRAALREPSWPLWAAHQLGVKPEDAPYPPSYRRGTYRS
jgi:2,4-dienoyl-CoA reductase-like NADH-dependent reductase (Old Yellow Enzyme family)